MAPDKLQNKFKKLHDQAQADKLLPFKVKCHVFESREEAREWLIKRHGGEQDGVGTRSWDPLQAQRFTKTSSYSLAESLIEYVAKNELIENQDMSGLITTVGRTFSTPEVRYEFGIVSGTSDALIEINVSIDDFNMLLKKYFNDLLIEKDSRISSRATKKQRIEYLDFLKSSNHLPLEKQASSFLLNENNTNHLAFELIDSSNDISISDSENNAVGDDIQSSYELNIEGVVSKEDEALDNPDLVESNPIDGADDDINSSLDVEDYGSIDSVGEYLSKEEVDVEASLPIKAKRLSNPHTRKYLIKAPCNLKNAPVKLKKIYSELKDSLAVQDTPYAVSTLFRVFLELSCDYYLNVKHPNGLTYNNFPTSGKSGKALEKDKLGEKVVAIAQELEKLGKIAKKELDAITSLSAEPKSISAAGTLPWLHSCVHNYAHSINPSEVINTYENYSHLLVCIWDEL